MCIQNPICKIYVQFAIDERVVLYQYNIAPPELINVPSK
jgi:hypothetical protein